LQDSDEFIDRALNSGPASVSSVSKTIDKTVLLAAPEHTRKNKCYLVCFVICTHWSFTLIITLLIVANTFVLALDKYPEDPELNNTTDILNEFFTWAFFLEMVIKLFGLGFKEYSRDQFNIFDAVVVILSIIDTIVG